MTTGKPCGRTSCGHGQGLHDEEGCAFCSCGYFLQADLMQEVIGLRVWSDVQGYNRQDQLMYGWLRVFEGYTHERANALMNGRTPRKVGKR